MEERYKSLAAMNADPWIEHFKKTAGDTSVLSTRPRPVVIQKPRNTGSGSGSDSGKDNDSLPLTIVSPVGQSNEMAEADLRMENDKRSIGSSERSVSGKATSTTQPQSQRGRAVKRKQTKPKSSNDSKKKKITKLKDIFSKHGIR